jgi:protein gp37
MGNSRIDWLADFDINGNVIRRGSSWNPVSGCNPISEGCKNCYAKRMTKRFDPDRDFSIVKTHPERLHDPLKWKSPRKVFVCSLSDLFNDNVSDEFIHDVLKSMIDAPQHIYMLLTKRPERMMTIINGFYDSYKIKPFDNWIVGTTIESDRQMPRIEYLANTQAAIKYISAEPLLSDLNLHLDIYNNISAVFAGCESGTGAGIRETKIDWFRNLRDQCMGNDVSFFLKQMRIYGKIAHMPKLDGYVWNQFPKR